MFICGKNELNEAQEKAIQEPGSVFLVACPGSGKTRTLTYKIARLLSELQSEKKRVVAITYTNRAADEIHERIEQLGVDTSQLWIGTIHAFCLEWILKPYAVYHPALKNGFRVVNGHESEEILEELCTQMRNPTITFRDCGYFFTTSKVRINCHDDKKENVKAALRKYWYYLKANRKIDFEFILYYSFQLIRDNPPISTILGSIFSSILVDEFQDTRETQYSILAAILKAAKGQAIAFIVGDPNQAIYGSIGGYAISAEEFGRQCNLSFREMDLSDNYRSSSRIVDYFGNYNVLSAKCVAVGKVTRFPSVITYDTETHRDELEAELIRLIRYNVEETNIPPHEVCIVAPWWIHLAGMTRRLAVALPNYSFNGPGMVPFARDIDNFCYKLARIVLTQATPGLFVRRMRWAGEVIAALSEADVNVGDLDRKALLRECNSIQIDETDGLTYLRMFFEEVLLKLGVDWRNNTNIRVHHDSFFESSQRRIARIVEEGSEAIAETVAFRRVFAEKSGITISTIHGVKGAEYDAVIAYGLLEGLVPFYGDRDKAAMARKLLYVVASRARKNLHLISERGRTKRWGDAYLPTEVLSACSFGYDATA